MKASSITLSGLIFSTLTAWNMAHANPYVVTQSQSFAMHPPVSALYPQTTHSLERYDWNEMAFHGTPASIMIAGEPAALTRVSFDLTSDLDYRSTVYCSDGPFSDCYTQGAYAIYHDWRTSESMFPMFEWFDRIVHFASRPSIQAHSFGSYGSTEDFEYERVLAEPGQSFSLSASDHDLSFLDIDDFVITVKRSLYLYLLDWDQNDEINMISIHHYSWEGNLTITYEYEYAPTPTPASEPGILLLVASGLIGLAGLRTSSKTRQSALNNPFSAS